MLRERKMGSVCPCGYAAWCYFSALGALQNSLTNWLSQISVCFALSHCGGKRDRQTM